MLKKIICLLPIIGASISIYLVSDIPNLHLPDLSIKLQDKVLHSFAYFIYGITISIALAPWFAHRTRWKVLLLASFIGMSYAFTDEYHQGFVYGRTSEFLDWCADSLGIITSQLIFNYVLKILYRLRLVE